MFEKDLMKEISSELNNLSEEETAQRARSVQQLLDNELKRRKAAPEKPAGFWGWLFGARK